MPSPALFPQGSIFFVSFAPSNASAETFALASGSDDRSIRLWHWQKGLVIYFSDR